MARRWDIHDVDASIWYMDIPLFRSEAQFRLLGELFTNPRLEVTIGDLATRTGVPQATVSREIGRLAESGLVRRRREGNRTLVSANMDTIVADDLRSLLAKLYGPVAAIRRALERTPGVEEAFIFGSWAARWRGEPGPPPNDLDLLVIGEVSGDDVWSEAATLSRSLGVDVNPIIRSREEWDADDTVFAAQVRDGPKVDVTPQCVTEATG